jgi:hypothetical protein
MLMQVVLVALDLLVVLALMKAPERAYHENVQTG